ncbi:MAG: NTP transferase domain-containing protein [Erysipelotrichaceae bacterium]|nr:NTP transferase domain-containing protein [Erysipelotrichaceae bacterium]MBR5049065.1 NTP transferase domain-containing protein [Erysipelotrichaceae bacterium]
MSLTYNQFEILTYLEKNPQGKVSQRQLSQDLKLSLSTINKTIGELDDLDYVKYDSSLILTMAGLKALEPYRVRRAIMLAAGFGSRMVPLTLNTPKPMIKVHGKPMIETLLDACIKAEIQEIIVVIGYLGEQFEILKKKYPNIIFLTNDLYNETNNISSALVAKDFFQSAYVMESDLVLYNDSLIRKYEYHSNFLGKYVHRTDDWCFEVNKKGVITEEKVGGIDCYHMYGISYFSPEDGLKLATDIPEVYESPGGKEKYWEQVPLVYRRKNYEVHIRECHEDDIVEIDTFNELKQIDHVYDC